MYSQPFSSEDWHTTFIKELHWEMIDNRHTMTNSIHYTVKTISKVSSSVILETPRKKYEWSELINCEKQGESF